MDGGITITTPRRSRPSSQHQISIDRSTDRSTTQRMSSNIVQTIWGVAFIIVELTGAPASTSDILNWYWLEN